MYDLRLPNQLNILSNEKLFLFIVKCRVALFGMFREETHLPVVRRSEDIFLLGIFCKLTGEDFLFDVRIGTDFGYLEGDTLVHELCVQVFTLDVFLHFS